SAYAATHDLHSSLTTLFRSPPGQILLWIHRDRTADTVVGRERTVVETGGMDHGTVDVVLTPEAAWSAARHVPRCEDGTHRVLLRSEEHTSELQSRENLVCRL